jgi:peptidyl-prolyl cis-trans isomerase A (cyclophilin A)
MRQHRFAIPYAVLCGLLTVHFGCAQESSLTKDSGKVVIPEIDNPALLDPTLATKTAPDKFKVKVETTKGDMIIEVDRSWSPNGADRFYNLVDIGYFKEIAFFRAIDGFMVQFGIHGNPKVNKVWRDSNIKDDPNVTGVSNQDGYLTFARTGAPDSRSTQFFLNLGNNKGLDRQGFTPLGKIVEGMDVLKKIETKYGENSNEVQPRFQSEGNSFIAKKYPDIDYIKSMSLVKE